MPNNNSEFYATKILDSIDTIVQSALSKVQFDITIECIVAEIDEKQKNIYTVSRDNVEFKAYSDKEYAVGDYVQVLVPSGDMEKGQKIILSKILPTSKEKQFRNSPLRNFIALSDSLYAQPEEGSYQTELPSGYMIEKISSFNAPLKISNYNRLGLSFDIQTFIQEDSLDEKDYFLIIRPVFCSNEESAKTFINIFHNELGNNEQKLISTIDQLERLEILKDFQFQNPDFDDSYGNSFIVKKEDLDGNVFQYETPTQQEALFYLDLKGWFCGADIYLAKKISQNEDVVIQNLKMWTGLEISLEDYPVGDNLILIPHMSLIYPNTESGDREGLSVLWFVKEDDGSITIKNEDITNQLKLHWFKTTLDTSEADPDLGYFWRNLTGVTSSANSTPMIHKIIWDEIDLNGKTEEEKKILMNNSYALIDPYSPIDKKKANLINFKDKLYYVKVEDQVLTYTPAYYDFRDHSIYYEEEFLYVKEPNVEDFMSGLYFIKSNNEYYPTIKDIDLFDVNNIYYYKTGNYVSVWDPTEEDFLLDKYYIKNTFNKYEKVLKHFDQDTQYYILFEAIHESNASQEDFDNDLYYSQVPYQNFYEKSKKSFDPDKEYYVLYTDADKECSKLTIAENPTEENFINGAYYIYNEAKQIYENAYEPYQSLETVYAEIEGYSPITSAEEITEENIWKLKCKKEGSEDYDFPSFFSRYIPWIIGEYYLEKYPIYQSAEGSEFDENKVYYSRSFKEIPKEESNEEDFLNEQYWIKGFMGLYYTNVPVPTHSAFDPETQYYVAEYSIVENPVQENLASYYIYNDSPSQGQVKKYLKSNIIGEPDYTYCVRKFDDVTYDEAYIMIKTSNEEDLSEYDDIEFFYKIKSRPIFQYGSYTDTSTLSGLTVFEMHNNNRLLYLDSNGKIYSTAEPENLYLTIFKSHMGEYEMPTLKQWEYEDLSRIFYYRLTNDGNQEYFLKVEKRNFEPEKIVYYHYPYGIQINLYEGNYGQGVYDRYYIDEKGSLILFPEDEEDIFFDPVKYILPYIIEKNPTEERFNKRKYYVKYEKVGFLDPPDYLQANPKLKENSGNWYYKINEKNEIKFSKEESTNLKRYKIQKLIEVFNLNDIDINNYYLQNLKTGEFYYYKHNEILRENVLKEVKKRKCGGFFDNILNYNFNDIFDYDDELEDFPGGEEIEEEINENDNINNLFLNQNIKDIISRMEQFHFINYDSLNQFYDYELDKLSSTNSTETFKLGLDKKDFNEWGVIYYLPRFFDIVDVEAKKYIEVPLQEVLEMSDENFKKLYIKRTVYGYSDEFNGYVKIGEDNSFNISLILKEKEDFINQWNNIYISQTKQVFANYDISYQSVIIPFYYEHNNILSLSINDLKNSFNKEADTSFKACLYNNDKKLIAESDQITFINQKPLEAKHSVDLIQDLELSTNDNNNGIYYIYNQIDKLSNSNKTISIKATFKHIYSGIDNWDLGKIKIEWEFPKEMTMLISPIETVSEIELTEEDYEGCKTSGEYITKSISTKSIGILQTFNESYLNNTVKCIVTKEIDGVIYKDEKAIDLKFAKEGSSGTKYTFKIQPMHNQYVLYPNLNIGDQSAYGERYIPLEAVLIDPSGIAIDISNKVNWSFEQIGAQDYKYNKTTEKLEKGNPRIGFYKYDGEELIPEAGKITQKTEITGTNIVAVGTKDVVTFTRKGLLNYIGYIVKAEVKQSTSFGDIIFKDYFAVPIAQSDMFQGQAPSFIWYDNAGDLIGTDIPLLMSVNKTFITSEKINSFLSQMKINQDMYKKVENHAKMVQNIEKLGQSNIYEAPKKILSGFQTFAKKFVKKETEDSLKMVEEWEPIEKNIKKIYELIEAQDHRYDFSRETFAYGTNGNYLTETIYLIEEWKRRYPVVYKEDFFYEETYYGLKAIEQEILYNEDYRNYLPVKEAFLTNIAPYLSSKGELASGIYYWDLEIIDASEEHNKILPDKSKTSTMRYYDDYSFRTDANNSQLLNNTKFQLLNAPNIKSLSNGSFTLSPPTRYYDIANNKDSQTHLALVCYRLTANKSLTEDGVELVDDYYTDTPIWAQPLRYIQDSFGIDYINEWDGNFLLDSANSKIFSKTIIAGAKNEENKFTGVIVGEIEKEDEKFGILGQQNGIDSFGLRVDGTAFFGKSGYGQIELDGDTGFLKLGTMQMRQRMFCAPDSGAGTGVGMVGGVADPEHVAFYAGYKGNGNQSADVGNRGTPYERSDWQTNTKFYVLHDGTAKVWGDIYAKNLYLLNDNDQGVDFNEHIGNSFVKLNKDYSDKSTGHYFKVENGGLLKATFADITGAIVATSGKIGNFYIGDSKVNSKLFGALTAYAGKTTDGKYKHLFIRATDDPDTTSYSGVVFGLLHTNKRELIDIQENELEIDDSFQEGGNVGSSILNSSWLFNINANGSLGSIHVGINKTTNKNYKGATWSIESTGRAIFGKNIQTRELQIYSFHNRTGLGINHQDGAIWTGDYDNVGINLNGNNSKISLYKPYRNSSEVNKSEPKEEAIDYSRIIINGGSGFNANADNINSSASNSTPSIQLRHENKSNRILLNFTDGILIKDDTGKTVFKANKDGLWYVGKDGSVKQLN